MEYTRYGGDTTCLEIRTASDDIVVVDAGTGIRRLGNALVQQGRLCCHMIFTHAHWDHVMGFPFFKPVFHREAELIMHKCPFQSNFVESILTKVMSPPTFPVRYRDLVARIHYEDACPLNFEIGSMEIVPIRLSHPNSGSGYKFIEDGRTCVFLTDNELGFVHPNGLTFDDYRAFCQGADLLIHDAEYTVEDYRHTKEWGHTTYPEAVELAIAADVGRLGLFHHNQDRTDDQVDAIVADCRRLLADKGSNIDCFAVGAGMHFEM